MGQITEDFARQMLVHCERKEHPPLTVWEAEQLARAWLDHERLRAALSELDVRLRECSTIPASAADAYDSYYQDLIAEALTPNV